MNEWKKQRDEEHEHIFEWLGYVIDAIKADSMPIDLVAYELSEITSWMRNYYGC